MVELLVASLIFSFILIIVNSNFVDILDLQRRGFAAQLIQEETLYMLEAMSREIRVSQITSPNQCGITSLSINHPIHGPIQYSTNTGIVNKTVGGQTVPMTSSKLNFSNMTFCVTGAGLDDQQPRIMIKASIRVVGGSGPTDLVFDIQTTVSSRDVTEEFIN